MTFPSKRNTIKQSENSTRKEINRLLRLGKKYGVKNDCELLAVRRLMQLVIQSYMLKTPKKGSAPQKFKRFETEKNKLFSQMRKIRKNLQIYLDETPQKSENELNKKTQEYLNILSNRLDNRQPQKKVKNVKKRRYPEKTRSKKLRKKRDSRNSKTESNAIAA